MPGRRKPKRIELRHSLEEDHCADLTLTHYFWFSVLVSLSQLKWCTNSLMVYCLYVTIFTSPYDQALAGVSLLDTHCRGKAVFSTRLDRSGKIVLPWAA